MKYILVFLTAAFLISCNGSSENSSANLSNSFSLRTFETTQNDTFEIPYQGVMHIEPFQSFDTTEGLFHQFLNKFKLVKYPFELSESMVDQLETDWQSSTAFTQEYYPFLLDKRGYEFIKSVENPLESLYDFYKIYPVVQLENNGFFKSVIYAVRYLDGYGQQDAYYLSTYSNKGRLISNIEIGAMFSATETYLKIAQINTKNLVKVTQLSYDNDAKDWVPSGFYQYYLDSKGQIFTQVEKSNYDKGFASNNGLFAFSSSAEFNNFLELFQKALKDQDKTELSSLLTFPHLKVAYQEHFEVIETAGEFFEKYEQVFNESLTQKILSITRGQLFSNEEGVGLPDKTLWFKRIGRDNNDRLVVEITVN